MEQNISNTKPSWDDTVLPFQLDQADIRGRVARLDGTLDKILELHNYPIEVSTLVAEAAILAALIGQTMALRWKLSLQVRGDGPIGLIATDYYAPTEDGAPARVRAYAHYKADQLHKGANLGLANLGKGMFAVLIDQGAGTKPYQGITPLAGNSLSDCAETYFAQSEQLPTRFQIVAAQETVDAQTQNWRAGGVIIQHMPKASPLMPGGGGSGEGGLLLAEDLVSGDDAENWNRAVILLNSVEEFELVGPHVTQDKLLLRLFHEEKPRVFPSQPIEFGCSCSEEKVRNAMGIYSAKEIATMLADHGMMTADCQFCGAHYELHPDTLGKDAKNPM